MEYCDRSKVKDSEPLFLTGFHIGKSSFSSHCGAKARKGSRPEAGNSFIAGDLTELDMIIMVPAHNSARLAKALVFHGFLLFE